MAGNNRASVADFEEKHMISTIIYLGTFGPSRKIDLYEGVSSNPRMPDKINHLEAMGLVKQTTDSASRSTIVSLTEKGRKVSEMFRDMETCIKSA